MGRSEWNNFVKKVYEENKSKSGFSLGDAMKLASKLKKTGKMSMSSSMSSSKKTRRSKKGGKSRRRRR